MNRLDLNDLFQDRPVVEIGNCSVTVSFSGNEQFIVDTIGKATAVVGCVPWLTSYQVMGALAALRDGVCMVVDKHAMHSTLQRDGPKICGMKPLPFRFNALPTDFVFTGPTASNSINNDSIRVFGRLPDGCSRPALLHYKFMVFCDSIINNGVASITPRSVLFGSYNFSLSASFNRESVLFLDHPSIAQAFFDEWARAYALSEGPSGYDGSMNPEYIPSSGESDIVAQLKAERNILHAELQMIDGYHDWDAAFYDKDVARWSGN